MGWFAAGSASYKALEEGLVEGKSPPCNRIGRKPKNLFLLPGGVAEIFEALPGRDAVFMKTRKVGGTRVSGLTGYLHFYYLPSIFTHTHNVPT